MVAERPRLPTARKSQKQTSENGRDAEYRRVGHFRSLRSSSYWSVARGFCPGTDEPYPMRLQ